MKSPKPSDKDHEQLAAVLCYFIVGIIWFFADDEMHKSELVKFHSKQAINLAVFNVSLAVVSLIIPVVGAEIGSIGGMLLLVLWVIGLISAVNEKQKKVPIIGDIANKYLHY